MERNRDANTSGGNYAENIGGNYIQAKTVYLSHPSSTTPNNNIPDQKLDHNGCGQRLAFAIAGSVEKADQAKLQAIVQLLRKITGDASIEIVDIQEGSIKLILSGSEAGLAKLKALFDAGELPEVLGTPVQSVAFVEPENVNRNNVVETDTSNEQVTNEQVTQEIGQSSNPMQRFIVAYSQGRRLFQEADLRDANLRGADLSAANFSGADLRGADLSAANFSNAKLMYTSLSLANLSGANLSGANLIEANFSHANLSDANLTWADLKGANFSNTNLSGAKLTGSNLSRAILSNAILYRVVLNNADLCDANLCRADLRGVILNEETQIDLKWRLVHQLVNEGGIGKDLSGADLSGASLSNANLSNANLGGTNLSGADLSGANLSRADLSRACLFGSNLSNANLSGAVVTECIFGEGIGLSDLAKVDLKQRGAIFSDAPGAHSHTTLPTPSRR